MEKLAGEKTGKHLIISTLLRVAVTMRYINDSPQTGQQVTKPKSLLDNGECGILKNNKNTEKLTPREACNKIIHGEEFLIQPKDTNERSKNIYFSSTIFIYGHSSDGKQKWKSTLNIIKFIKACQKAIVTLETALHAES